MATNSSTCLPLEVESGPLRPAIWTGLDDVLLTADQRTLWGSQHVLWECMLSAASYLVTRP